ncbi:MAG TPA: sigma factor-like helix-turn-helix DNA-binding protein [Isosphaeraceae bacterium]|nr:sigma factor-like helix-turn-helix DNA-binding protein [Isosphaeraceae bacterium]
MVQFSGSTILAERLGHPPTDEEVGKALYLSKKKADMVAKAMRVNNLIVRSESPGGDGSIMDEVLTDGGSKSPDHLLIEADEVDRIMERMAMLDDREETIIRLRFGLDDQGPRTLREVGEVLGLTRERVRQLEKQARAKLVEGLVCQEV